MAYWFIQTLVCILAKLLFGLKVYGAENIPKRGAFILASNHRSNLDPPMIAVSVRRKLFFLTKAELFENNVFAAISRSLNCIRVNRTGIDRVAGKKALKALKSGRGLLLFPEGKRSRDGKLGKGKAGIALFAFALSVPVIPTFIKGSESALPIGSSSIKLHRISVSFGKPFYHPLIKNKNNKKQVYQDFVDKIMKEISELEKRQA